MTTRSWWGWGAADRALRADALEGLGGLLTARFGRRPPGIADPVDPRQVRLPPPRIRLPDTLADLADHDPVERLRHGHGSAFRDVARALNGDVPQVPDLVVRPRTPEQVAAVLDHATGTGIAVVPFGGGSSVVGGVTPPAGPCLSLDMERLDRLVELDALSGAARIQAGAYGPAIEEQLRPHGLTLRHFPQSWEFSSLGGWIATRAAGHYATGPTHIDDLVESVTACTPVGWWSSARVPGSGAGPSPDRLLLGSEGTLGVITEAWVRVTPRPRHRGQATVAFPSFAAGLEAVRAVVQDGLRPANCRLLDATEAALSGAGDPDRGHAVLVLGFEAVDAPVDAQLARALCLLADHGGVLRDGPTVRHGDESGKATGGAGAWRQAFVQAPYLRDGLIRVGAVVETFETATTWDRASQLVDDLREAAGAAARQVCGAALVAVRTTHAYPDGVAPYLTVIAPGPSTPPGVARGRGQASAWDEIKAAVSEVIVASGATITHHHAVGRDHRPSYERQRPVPFGLALAAAKAAVDPAGVLNPGVLLAARRDDERPPAGSPQPAR